MPENLWTCQNCGGLKSQSDCIVKMEKGEHKGEGKLIRVFCPICREELGSQPVIGIMDTAKWWLVKAATHEYRVSARHISGASVMSLMECRKGELESKIKGFLGNDYEDPDSSEYVLVLAYRKDKQVYGWTR